MQKTKLLTILKTFQWKELKGLEKYIQSPYFNQNTKVSQLYTLIIAAYPAFDDKMIDRQYLHQQLYGENQAYDDVKMRKNASLLTKLVEGYLIQEQLKSKDYYEKYLLLEAYSSRFLDKQFEQLMKQTRKALAKEKEKNADYYYYQYLIEEQQFLYDVFVKSRPKQTNLQAVIDHFDIYYQANKLRYSCVVMNRQSILSVDYRDSMFGKVLKDLENNPFAEVPAIRYYYQILLLFQEPQDEKHFKQMIQLLSTRNIPLPTFEQRQLYNFTVNYCVRRIREGKLYYYESLFQLYHQQIDSQVIMVGQYLSPNNYINITKTGLILQHFDWVADFMENYKNKLHPKVRASIYDYCVVNMDFAKGNYRTVIQKSLQKIELQDALSLIWYKTLLLQSYYHINDEDNFELLVQSFRDVIRRNKTMSNVNRLAYKNFVDFTWKLYRHRRNKGSYTSLKKELEELEPVVQKQWLEELMS